MFLFITIVEDVVKNKKPWHTKGVFIILAIAFGVTSFQGSVWRLFQPVVFRVGNEVVRSDEFKRLVYFQQLMRYQKFNASGVDESLLTDVVRHKIVALNAQDHGITVSRKSAEESIRRFPLFTNGQGDFSQKKLDSFLRSSHLTLFHLVAMERERMAGKLLKEALEAQVVLPATLENLLVKGFFQERVGRYRRFPYVPDRSAVSPTTQQLKDLFEKNPLVAKKSRKYHFLRLSVHALAGKVSVSEKEIKDYHSEKFSDQELEKVRPIVVAKLKKRMAGEQLESLLVKIEDALGAGDSLEKISKQFDLPIVTLFTDDAGYTESGEIPQEIAFEEKKGKAESLRNILLQAVFQAPIGQDAELVPVSEGESFFVAVEKEVPEKKLSFQQAKAFLTKIWHGENAKKRAQQEAEDFLQKIVSQKNSPTSKGFKKSSGTVGLGHDNTLKDTPLKNMEYVPSFSMNTPPKKVPLAVVNALFRMKPLDALVVQGNKAVYVVQLDSVTEPDVKNLPDLRKQGIRESALKDLQKIFWKSYLNSLQKKYSVSFEKDKKDLMSEDPTENPGDRDEEM